MNVRRDARSSRLIIKRESKTNNKLFTSRKAYKKSKFFYL